jgi:hypothetical protein
VEAAQLAVVLSMLRKALAFSERHVRLKVERYG